MGNTSVESWDFFHINCIEKDDKGMEIWIISLTKGIISYLQDTIALFTTLTARLAIFSGNWTERNPTSPWVHISICYLRIRTQDPLCLSTFCSISIWQSNYFIWRRLRWYSYSSAPDERNRVSRSYTQCRLPESVRDAKPRILLSKSCLHRKPRWSTTFE